MAQCQLTSREFIRNAFSPQIGAICSANADAICQKNNLSFVELLQPFCIINTEGHFKDPQGTNVTIKNLRLSIQDIFYQPPEPMAARKMLNDSVSSEYCDRLTDINIGNVTIQIPLSLPWFDTWREMFLNVQFPSDHEFTKHYLACMIVVSTVDDNPLEKIQQMATQLNQNPIGKLPKWFNNNTLRYYILIHDSSWSDDKMRVESTFNEMKNLYDANNCFLLQINSQVSDNNDENIHLPDPWSKYLMKKYPCDINSSENHSSSPRTPADTRSITCMPNEVISGSDKSSQVGTPIAGHNPPILLSPDVTDKLSLTSEIFPQGVMTTSSGSGVEVGQEAVTVKTHPLSPDNEKQQLSFTITTSSDNMKFHMANSPINTNVWADSPNKLIVQHGAKLSIQDLDRIKSMINEFYLKSLLPYVEKQISILNDVISNKKGVSRSLFSATKRWFGTNKPGVTGSQPTNSVVYTIESPELQLRRLGDLCFMFNHYTLAYQAYHSAKRDFAADQAWLYYAGALEMAALSAFMQNEMNRKTIEYMDDSILTYLNNCKMPQFATRATLLSVECLNGKNLYGDAAKQLIRMTSEDSDLRSALLLEQAAYCFVSSKMIHKYAFQIVLAGHRYSKAGQRKHSLRCYQQAYQIYNGKGWSLAEDHINFTIGRQAALLKQLDKSVKAFERLLNPNSKQPPAQQIAFLREFLHIHNLLIQDITLASSSLTSNHNELPILPLPLIDSNQIQVLLGPIYTSNHDYITASGINFELNSNVDKNDDNNNNNYSDNELKWNKLEELIVTEAQGNQPMIFKPSIILYTNNTNNNTKPNAIVDEPIHLSVQLYNPLRISIPLYKIKLIWSFTNDNQTVTNETMSENSLSESVSVDTTVIDNILLEPLAKKYITLSCTPTLMGNLKILGISYNLSTYNNNLNNINSSSSGDDNDKQLMNTPSIIIHGKRLFEIRGPKLKNINDKSGSKLYATDNRLDINIIDKSPFLQIFFTKIKSEMLCGEMQRLEVTFKNIGNAPMKNIYIGSTNPKLFCLENELNQYKIINNNNVKLINPVIKINLPSSNGGILNIGETYKMPLWIRAPNDKGNIQLNLLFYYENLLNNNLLKYRICRHTWKLKIINSIQSKIIVRPSGIIKNHFRTMNLIIEIKNTNQLNDTHNYDIILTNLSLKSNIWKLIKSNKIKNNNNSENSKQFFVSKIQPQETFHLFIKLIKKSNDEKNLYSDISLISEDSDDNTTTITESPYIDFVEKSQIVYHDLTDSSNNFNSTQMKSTNNPNADSSLIDPMKLKSLLILRWKAKIRNKENEVDDLINQTIIGQHHINVELVNKLYKHPEEIQIEQNETTRLKIFGPDRNISNVSTIKNDIEILEFQKNIIVFSLSHVRQTIHEFDRQQICIIPVVLNLQNNTQFKVDVKVNTIGTSSQSYLPNIKLQLYSPQASTFFRYASHTTISCHIEPYNRHTIKLQAIFSTPGTYDLASRLNLLAKTIDYENYVSQKWKTESICTIYNKNM